MRIPRLFHPPPLATGITVELEPDVARHVRSVLRLDSGAAVELFDGFGNACAGQLQLEKPRRVLVVLETPRNEDRESSLRVELALGVSRGERMDLAIQKAVELGVAAIHPLFTRRSVVRLDAQRAGKRLVHWQRVVRSACGQCGRNTLPALASPAPLDRWLGQLDDDALALMPTPGAEQGLRAMSPPHNARVRLLIGPEGGLDPQERAAAAAAGFAPIRLGPRVLRTETAAMAAITALMTLWGDLA